METGTEQQTTERAPGLLTKEKKALAILHENALRSFTATEANDADPVTIARAQRETAELVLKELGQ